MNSKTIADGIIRAVLILVGIYLLLKLLISIKIVLLYILLASVLSLIGRPVVLFLKNKLKFNQSIAALVSMLMILGVFTGLFFLFIPLLVQQGENLSLLNISELKTSIEASYNELLLHLNIDPTSIDLGTESLSGIKGLNLEFIPEVINGLLGFLGSFSAGLFATLFITFFFLKDSKMLENTILLFMPKEKHQKSKEAFSTIKNLLSRYFLGLLLQILILFLIYTISLTIFEVPNAMIIAFLCALLNLIPYIGPVLGALLMSSLTMSSFLGADFADFILPKTIYVLIGFAVGQLVDNLFTQPFIFSNSVKSHPLEIFLIIVVGGLVSGPIGMVLAIPFYTSLKVILKVFFKDYSFVKSLTKNL